MRRNAAIALSLLVLLLPGAAAPARAACTANVPNANVIESTPTADFTVNGDGTVTHIRTGLMWKQCTEGQGGPACDAGAATGMTWGEALNAANSANAAAFAGHTDWRLPNIKELESIVELCGHVPAINRTVFPATPSASLYWSSTPATVVQSMAWYVYFASGEFGTTAKSSGYLARLVRGGQPLDSFDVLIPEVVEFYNSNLDHYFITANAGEAAAIDSGSAGPGWSRTGNSFKSGGSIAVCRFYGSPSPGPNSHFYAADPAECASLKQLQAVTPATEKRWNFESNDFNTTLPVNRACAAGTSPVYRAYNNGFTRGIDSNHRITGDAAGIQAVVARGWADEGVVMCSPN